jgi:proline iminopeptidase
MIHSENQGMINVLGYNLFYEIFEPKNGTPKGTVLTLAGGPGCPHQYILPMSDLTNYGYRVIFYDQLGIGRSEMPQNKYMFSIEYNVEEVEALRVAMNLGKINLWGSSYGGALAIAYALKYQRNLKCLITAGGLASVPLTVEGMMKWKSELPLEVLSVLDKYESVGDYENPEYINAMMVFYHRYVCRLPEWPEEFVYTNDNISKPVYHLMNGPNEYTIIGNLKYWDVTDKLPTIKVPTLVTGGRYDEVSPKVAESIHRGIKGSKRLTFENSAHTPFWDEREKYLEAVAKFLDQVNVPKVKSKKGSKKRKK